MLKLLAFDHTVMAKIEREKKNM